MQDKIKYKPLDYLDQTTMPFMWCPGCGDGIVVRALCEAFAALGLPPHQIVMVTGIGCWGKADDYFATHTFHGSHGRALAFGSGIKAGNPELHVVALMGDGDAAAIGGNHFIHAARRNMDITAVVVNNFNYGMTGGQYSPTSPFASSTSTSVQGVPEPPFDLCLLAASAGAVFTARTTVFHVVQMKKLLEQALQKKGFSLVEVLSPCPTHFGRRNYSGGALAMLAYLKEHAVPLLRYEQMSEEEKSQHFPTGVLTNSNRPDFLQSYWNITQQQNKGTAPAHGRSSE